jgi:hypothetical protein
VHLDPCSA